MIMLELSSLMVLCLEKAFIPLADCYKEEELFDSSIFIGEQNNETVGFVAFNKHEITWLYIDPKIFPKWLWKKIA